MTFVQTSLPSVADWRCVAYGGSKFVAFAYGTNCAAYSSDGNTWTSVTTPVMGNWTDVVYGNGKFVVVGNSKGLYSTIGTSWTSMTMPDGGWQGVAYGNGKFVAVASGVAAYSADGISWTSVSIGGSGQTAIVYGNGRFVSIGTGAVYYSEDGTEWASSELPSITSPAEWKDIAYGNGKYVIIARNAARCLYSDDGVLWEEGTLPSSASWNSIAYGPQGFIVVGGTNTALVSSDGTTWGTVASRTWGSLTSNTWGSLLGWETLAQPSNSQWVSIAYGNDKYVEIDSSIGCAAYCNLASINGFSAEYRADVLEGNRHTVSVIFSDADTPAVTAFYLTGSDRVYSFTADHALSGEGCFWGTASASEFTLVLNVDGWEHANEKFAGMMVGVNDEYDYSGLGMFLVDTVERSGSKLTLTGLDLMTLLDYPAKDAGIDFSTGKSIKETIQAYINYAPLLSYEEDSILSSGHSTYTIATLLKAEPENYYSMTARQHITDLCKIAGINLYYDGMLSIVATDIKDYSSSVDYANARITTDKYYSLDCDTKGFVMNGVKLTVDGIEAESVLPESGSYAYPSVEEGAYTVDLGIFYGTESSSFTASVLSGFAALEVAYRNTRLLGTTGTQGQSGYKFTNAYHSFEAECVWMPWMLPGMFVRIDTQDGTTLYGVIESVNSTLNGRTVITGFNVNDVQGSYRSLSNTDATVTRSSRFEKLESSSITVASGTASATPFTTGGLSKGVYFVVGQLSLLPDSDGHWAQINISRPADDGVSDDIVYGRNRLELGRFNTSGTTYIGNIMQVTAMVLITTDGSTIKLNIVKHGSNTYELTGSGWLHWMRL